MSRVLQTPKDTVPAASEEASGSPFDDGILDASEKKRIRAILSSAISFLASRRLLPAVLMKVGPLRVLLPIVWGVGFLRSKRWVAGSTFLGIGLFSLAMAFKPEFQIETAEAEDEPSTTTVKVEETPEQKHETKSSKVSSFLRSQTGATSAKTASLQRSAGTSSFHDPIFSAADAENAVSQRVRPAAASSAKGGKPSGVWLLGTIEEVDQNKAGHRTATTGWLTESTR